MEKDVKVTHTFDCIEMPMHVFDSRLANYRGACPLCHRHVSKS